jgi:hypothetical protein
MPFREPVHPSITQEDGGADHVVESGGTFTIRGSGLTVVSALQASTLAR